MSLLVAVLAGVAFFGLVMASVALHELGHLVPAKRFGIAVPQFFVGFGRTLWSTRRRGTEYGLKLLPLGGYVRLVGMYPPARPATGHREGWLARMADEARAAEYTDITPEQAGRLFHTRPTWQKVVVMAGGPLMNLLLAFCILLGVNLAHGQYRNQLVAEQVSECVVPAAAARPCTDADPQAPARAMGIRPGDRIVAFNGTRLDDWQQLSELIRDNGANPATVVVARGGTQLTLPTTPTVVTGVRDRLDASKTVEAGFLGVTPTVALVHGGPVVTAKDLMLQARQSLVALAGFPVKVWHVAADLVTGRQRDANGPVSIVGASRAAGEIAGSSQLSVGDRIASWFAMLASVNLFVFLLNCVPLPPLDGGHIAGALYESAKRGLWRLLGRPDPGHADTARLLPVAYAVGGFLALAGLVLVLADLISPVKIF